MKSLIPKRIIQTGKSFDLSPLSKAAVSNVKLLNPDYEYLFFDNELVEAFIAREFPQYTKIFDAFRFPIQRYDFFRYLAVYHFGGFYLDLDVFLSSSLSALLDFGCVFPFEELTINKFLRQRYGMDWEIGNYAFGAAERHPFLEAVIRNCVKAQQDPNWVQAMMKSIPRVFRERYYVLYTTGPGLISRTLAEYPDADKHIKVLFPDDVCNRELWHQFGTFGVHLMEGTWHRQKNIVYRRLAAMWQIRREKKLFGESASLGKTRSLDWQSRI